MQSNKVLQILYRKRVPKKQSQSSIKLPPVISKKQSRSNQSSSNKINCSNISIQSINPQLIKSNSKPTIQNYRINNPYRKKPRSRAEIARLNTEGISSFQSPLNSVMDNQLDNTLQNFIKDVEKNKQQIFKERNKKKQQNRYLNKNNQKGEKKKLSYHLRSQQIQIFEKAQNIISKNVTNSCQLNLDEVKRTLIYQKIGKIIKKVNPDKSLNNLKSQIMNEKSNSKQIKGENNYSQWRRTNILSTQQSIRYKKSTFENQSQRIGQLTLKTEATISKYLQNRQILLDLRNKIQKSR